MEGAWWLGFIFALVLAVGLPWSLVPNSDSFYADREAVLFDAYNSLLAEPQQLASSADGESADQGERLITQSQINNTPRFLGVMSFNIRLDGEERDRDNHFTNRVDRLRDTILKWRPALVGMQEPFGPQVHHLLSVLGQELPGGKKQHVRYRVLGYNRPGMADPDNLLHPARHYDVGVGILYRADFLELVDSAFYWLGEGDIKTSEKEIEFGSQRAPLRKANVGVFRILDRNLEGQKSDTEAVDQKSDTEAVDQEADAALVLHVNTHLTVFSEAARRDQARELKKIINIWRKKYPSARVFVTGDFNSAPGQAPHRTLLGKNEASSAPPQHALRDSWVTCSSESWRSAAGLSSCEPPIGPANSFHGWLGTWTDLWPVRAALPLLHTFHAMQLNVPIQVPPLHPRAVYRAVVGIFAVSPQFGLFESMPTLPSPWNPFSAPSRYHVDWILHDGTQTTPRVLLIGDVRSQHFSSDHYPVIGLFELLPQS